MTTTLKSIAVAALGLLSMLAAAPAFADLQYCDRSPPRLDGNWDQCPAAPAGGDGTLCTIHWHEGLTGEVTRTAQDHTKIEAHIKCSRGLGQGYDIYAAIVDCSAHCVDKLPHVDHKKPPNDTTVSRPQCGQPTCCRGPLTNNKAQKACAQANGVGEVCGHVFHKCGANAAATLSAEDTEKFCKNLLDNGHEKTTMETIFDTQTGRKTGGSGDPGGGHGH